MHGKNMYRIKPAKFLISQRDYYRLEIGGLTGKMTMPGSTGKILRSK